MGDKVVVSIRVETANMLVDIVDTMMKTAPMPECVHEFYGELCDALASREAEMRERLN
jgi:GTP1/Obg family GTP-binding protein